MSRRLVAALILTACTRDPRDPPRPPPSPPPVLPALAPSRRSPPLSPALATPRIITLWTDGLGPGRETQSSSEFTAVVVDVAAGTLTATDPENKPRTRTLDPPELATLLMLADAARTEPALAQSQASDYFERLDISDGHTVFEVSNGGGPINRPAAAKLVAALNTAARWRRH